MGDANLDALILELDRDVQGEDPEPAAVPTDPGPGLEPPVNQIHEQVDNQPVLPQQPLGTRGSPLIAKYISSSSAKRRAIKAENCCFCHQDHDRETMEVHLEQNERCQILYSRKFHVKTVDAILCRLYECLFCSSRAPKLFAHLESNEECRNKYLEKFDVESSRQAVDKVIKLRRTGYKSRRSLSRAVENVSAKKKKIKDLQKEPPETFLNSHLQRTLYSNYRTCIGCLSNLSAADEISTNSDCVKSGLYSIEDKKYLQRLGKYWICKHCQSKSEEEKRQAHDPLLEMNLVLQDNQNTFFPKLVAGERGDEAGDGHTVEDRDHLFDASKKTSIMLPSSTECLKSIKVLPDMKSLSSFQVQSLVYGPGSVSHKEAALIYQHQLLKYHRAKNNGELFFGKVESVQTKTLSGVQMCSQESKIVGSDGWRRSQQQDLSWKREQLGNLCVKLSVKFSLDDETSQATSLVQKGFVLTATLHSNETGEMRRSYFVHTGHDSSSACLDECPEIPMTEYLQQNGLISQPDAGTYISSVDLLVNSYIANVVKSPSSSFRAKDYHFVISFKSDGSVVMEGFIWPNCFREHNLIKFDKDILEDKVRSETIKRVSSCISSSTNIRVIKAQFNLSDSEASSLLKLVETHQIHICKNDECERCRNPPLPSLECKYTEVPPAPENIPSSIRFLNVMKKLLCSLSPAEIKATATVEWLKNVWKNNVEISEPVEANFWRIHLESEDFYFKLDDSLLRLLEKYDDETFVALYQYCIGVRYEDQPDIIIMKRLNLLDAYTSLYTPFFLKAANSSIKVELMTSNNTVQDWSFDQPDNTSCHEESLYSHVKVPLGEAYSLVDNSKLRVKSSCPTEFVYVGSDSSVLLKKVTTITDDCFKVEGENGYYELQETIVSRYFKRLNGENLTLAETATHYEFVGKDKSKSHYEVFIDKLDKIPASTFKSVSGGHNLPELIICSNKDVLTIRKRPKVLMYQSFDEDSQDYKFGQVLLFSSEIRDFHQLTPIYVDEAFGDVDLNTGERQIVRNRRTFYKLIRDGSEDDD